jgi:hypothetical protein
MVEEAMGKGVGGGAGILRKIWVKLENLAPSQFIAILNE